MATPSTQWGDPNPPATHALANDPVDRFAVTSGDAMLLIGRVLMGWIFVQSGFAKLTGITGFAQVLASRGVPAPSVMAWVGAIVEFFGGLALILGLKIRWASLLMVLFVIIATLISHRYWEFVEPAARRAQEGNFFKNLAMIGGLLFLFVVGSGRFSLDSVLWRRRL